MTRTSLSHPLSPPPVRPQCASSEAPSSGAASPAAWQNFCCAMVVRRPYEGISKQGISL
jgi:hypothetical protein